MKCNVIIELENENWIYFSIYISYAILIHFNFKDVTKINEIVNLWN